MIKNIIFDFGGVIVTIDHQEATRRFYALGLADAVKQLDPYTQTGIFGALEEGLISAEDFRMELSAMVGRDVTFEECKYCWLGYRKEVPQRNLNVLKRLKSEGYRLILLSNTNPFMMSWAESDEFDGMGHSVHYYFDATYMSYLVGCMKPDCRFFSTVLKSESILPDETLFIDDGNRNVEMASSMGIHTFCPLNGQDWTVEIYDYLH